MICPAGGQGIAGARFAIHLCRGNNAEYDDHRSGSFEPLAAVPDDKQVVLGLVSTKKAELEQPGELRDRVGEAAGFFPRDTLGLSTQCGFASIAAGNPITEADEERKLRLVADTALDVVALAVRVHGRLRRVRAHAAAALHVRRQQR